MATTVVKTIGTGGDYSTLQAWEDACPANLVTADQIWRGEVKNQAFVSSSSMLIISGTTVDSTHYVELTTEAGASFVDNASVRTNALRFNSANGASIEVTDAYAYLINVNQNYTKISKLQLLNSYSSGAAGSYAALNLVSGPTGCDINQCIIEGFTAGAESGPLNIYGANTVRNSLIINRRTSGTSGTVTLSGGAAAYNCTFISCGASGGITTYYGATVQNCYLGGNTTVYIHSAATATNCKTSVASPPSGWTVAAFDTANFSNVTPGSHDLRLVTGSALIDAGTTDSTNAPVDVSGLTRTGSWDVGAWEYSASSGNGTGTGAPAALSLTAPAATGSGTVSGTGAGAPASLTLTVPAATGAGTSSGTDGTGSGAPIAMSMAAPSASAAGTTSGSGTLVTPVLKNNTGTILASETGITVNVYNATTGALVLHKTGQTSDGSGVVTVIDAALTPATTYAYEVVLSGGARRLPTGTVS